MDRFPSGQAIQPFLPSKAHLWSIREAWKSSTGKVEHWGNCQDLVFFFSLKVFFFFIGCHFVYTNESYTTVAERSYQKIMLNIKLQCVLNRLSH